MKKDNEIYEIYDPSLFDINDFDGLLHEILKELRAVLGAEAGSIYISEKDVLSFNVFQNDAMSYENIYKQFYALKDVKLPLSEQEKYLAVKSFVSNKIIIIDDVYNEQEFNFLGVKEFDKRFNYRTKSIISAPIIHPLDKKKLGVIQLLNKLEDNELSTFSKKDEKVLIMISSFIALSIFKAQEDISKLKNLNLKLKDANKELKKKVDLEVKESERKSAIIFHQSKLASLGEMIGNIAHQWRQPLSAISTIASGINFNIEIEQCNQTEIKKGLNQIVKTTQHLSHTIDDFRNFYRIDKNEKVFNLSQNIKQSIAITDASLSENYIQVFTNLDKSINIFGYENEMKQAVLNIIQNSKDAILENTKKSEERLIFIDLIKDKKKVILSIKDNANGIPLNIIDKIFDQNFTTKDEKGGTGIGLYMTKEIITKHMDGTLTVSNTNFTHDDKSYTGALFQITFKLNSNKNL